MTAEILSRIQFALNISFHYIYPPLSIGLGIALVIMEGMYVKTGKKLYEELAKFWTKIFALIFAMGVATGLVQVFGFGTNWARYSRFVGDVFGSALGAEGVFAFFMESGFLGIMLFGWDRIHKGLHYFATICVCIGAHFSAVWIIVANSWMQTPAGYKIEGEGEMAHAVITDFWAMVFNPSSVDRLCHTIIGCWLAGAFLVISVSAFYMLKKRHMAHAQVSMKVGLWMALAAVILQLISADSTARGVSVNQPIKLAAMEGVYDTNPYTPMNVFGWVDTKTGKVEGLQIPGLLSFLTYRNFETPVRGLNEFPKEDWPMIQPVFQFYHLMIAMYGLMCLAVAVGFFLWKRKKLAHNKWVLRFLVGSVAFPQIANQAGWFTAEMGRQPWIVYGVMRTSEGVSRNLSSAQVIGSITMFVFIYILIFSLFIYLLNHKIHAGPSDAANEEPVYSDFIFKGGR
ncbi:MAG: cytochrome ubiquinol oxidase subunit I [Parachlamydiales bacterium]|nr:cytochrome ubiquinol oxidase subunit I [Parachlamydiales bacterium]